MKRRARAPYAVPRSRAGVLVASSGEQTRLVVLLVTGFFLILAASVISSFTASVGTYNPNFVSTPSGVQSQGGVESSQLRTSAGEQPVAPTTSSSAAPQLAAPGLGPQGGDATVIVGVNTAGTVKVNNLA